MRADAYPETFAAHGPAPAEGGDDGWLARLALEFERRRGRSVMVRNAHEGPLRVQRPFYPEGDDGACHVYLLHPPGGVVGSDRLELSVRAGVGSHALVTTPGAGKLYRTRGPLASVTQQVQAAAGACVELLPQETIAFRGAEASLVTRVDLEEGARALGWDILCLGRPAAGERFDAGRVRQRIELWRAGKPLWWERADYVGGAPVMQEPWGLGGHSVVGTLWCAPAEPAWLEVVREACAPDSATTAFTLVRGVLVGRSLGASSAVVRAALERAWTALRACTGYVAAARPRVWNT